MRQLYTGVNLYSNNSHVGIVDQEDKRIFHKRLPNHADVVVTELEPFRNEIISVTIESTLTGIGMFSMTSPFQKQQRLMSKLCHITAA